MRPSPATVSACAAAGQLALLERDLAIEQRQARLALEAARERWRLAEEGFRALDRRRAQLDQAYTAGEMPLVEVIRARVAAFDADLGRARARAGQDRARAFLNQALGVMP